MLDNLTGISVQDVQRMDTGHCLLQFLLTASWAAATLSIISRYAHMKWSGVSSNPFHYQLINPVE
jgi:hypothetical protein